MVSKSIGRITPRTVMVWFSELIPTFFVPSTTRLPLRRTCVTRAETVVVRVVVRLVVPCPSKVVWPPRFARFAQGPVAFVSPASAVMLLWALDLREVCVAPVLTAEALSFTTMVTMSSTRRER